MKKIFLLLYLCVILSNIAISQNIMDVKQYSFRSLTYNDTRSFRIALPASVYPNVKYNVLFVLDADYTFDAKYGFRDYRGGGRSSGRETNSRLFTDL